MKRVLVVLTLVASAFGAYAGSPECAGSLEPANCERIQAMVNSKSEAQKKAMAAKIEANKKAAEKFAKRKSTEKEGVKIGYTKEQVLNSTWGKPQKINTTTNAYGTHEQWIYGGGNYLYFDNDVLTTIQN
jgi:hypothetical protein